MSQHRQIRIVGKAYNDKPFINPLQHCTKVLTDQTERETIGVPEELEFFIAQRGATLGKLTSHGGYWENDQTKRMC